MRWWYYFKNNLDEFSLFSRITLHGWLYSISNNNDNNVTVDNTGHGLDIWNKQMDENEDSF